MASFDPLTAYAGAHAHIPGVVTGTLHYRNADGSDSATASVKVHREDITTSDFRNAAMAMGVSTTDTLFCLWKVTSADADPSAGDTIVADGVTWIIQKSTEKDFGPIWLVSVRQGVANAT